MSPWSAHEREVCPANDWVPHITILYVLVSVFLLECCLKLPPERSTIHTVSYCNVLAIKGRHCRFDCYHDNARRAVALDEFGQQAPKYGRFMHGTCICGNRRRDQGWPGRVLSLLSRVHRRLPSVNESSRPASFETLPHVSSPVTQFNDRPT